MGLTRVERAADARKKAEEWAKKAALLEAKEKDTARKMDTARKVIVGVAVIAAIRSGKLTRETWEAVLLPGLSERDLKRLGAWPTWEGLSEP